MFGLWDGSSRFSRMLAFILAVWINSSAVFALITTPGSPCADACGTTTNTTSGEISCVDQSYNQTTTGKIFEKCISCQLDSEFHDANTGESDVNWGLCMLCHPPSAGIAISPGSNSPNQITCATLFQRVSLESLTRSQMSHLRALSHAMAFV
jgi:hypothetical protein